MNEIANPILIFIAITLTLVPTGVIGTSIIVGKRLAASGTNLPDIKDALNESSIFTNNHLY